MGRAKPLSGESVKLLLQGEIAPDDGPWRATPGDRFGKSSFKVYEAAGFQQVPPYLLVWLHGMDNGSIEPGYLAKIQSRLQHRVIFMVPMSPQTTEDGLHFNWGCAFRKKENKKQLGYVFGQLHE
ncbi:unnamed protein product, partial [Effrenium voratum]